MYHSSSRPKIPIFYGHADRKGGQLPWPWPQENVQFWPIFKLFDSWILKTHLFHCYGSQKCIFPALYTSAIPLSDHFLTEQQQVEEEELRILVVG